MHDYKKQLEAKLNLIKGLDDLMTKDETIKKISILIKNIMNLQDNASIGNDAMHYAQQLLGHYYRIGNKHAMRRAERKAKEMTYKEVLSGITVMNKTDKVGITEAKAMATEQMQEFSNDQIEAEYLEDAYEHITKASSLAIMLSMAIMKEAKRELIASNIN
jgi:hypothetical protein